MWPSYINQTSALHPATGTLSAAVELRLSGAALSAQPTESDRASLRAAVEGAFAGAYEIKNFVLSAYSTAERVRVRARRGLLANFWVVAFDVVTTASSASSTGGGSGGGGSASSGGEGATTALDLAEAVSTLVGGANFSAAVMAAAPAVAAVEVQTVVASTRRPTPPPTLRPTLIPAEEDLELIDGADGDGGGGGGGGGGNDDDGKTLYGFIPTTASAQLVGGASAAALLLLLCAGLVRRRRLKRVRSAREPPDGDDDGDGDSDGRSEQDLDSPWAAPGSFYLSDWSVQTPTKKKKLPSKNAAAFVDTSTDSPIHDEDKRNEAKSR